MIAKNALFWWQIRTASGYFPILLILRPEKNNAKSIQKHNSFDYFCHILTH